MLGHHEVVSLWPVDAFLALNGANTELGVLEGASSNLTDGSNTTDSGRHLGALLTELFYGARSILSILARNLWTVAL